MSSSSTAGTPRPSSGQFRRGSLRGCTRLRRTCVSGDAEARSANPALGSRGMPVAGAPRRAGRPSSSSHPPMRRRGRAISATVTASRAEGSQAARRRSPGWPVLCLPMGLSGRPSRRDGAGSVARTPSRACSPSATPSRRASISGRTLRSHRAGLRQRAADRTCRAPRSSRRRRSVTADGDAGAFGLEALKPPVHPRRDLLHLIQHPLALSCAADRPRRAGSSARPPREQELVGLVPRRVVPGPAVAAWLRHDCGELFEPGADSSSRCTTPREPASSDTSSRDRRGASGALRHRSAAGRAPGASARGVVFPYPMRPARDPSRSALRAPRRAPASAARSAAHDVAVRGEPVADSSRSRSIFSIRWVSS